MEKTYERPDSEILFTRAVKAGKRIYYVDVKQDRHGEYYVSLTESKRIKDGTDDERPVFEKHKIFLYREDIARFSEAFQAAADYAQQRAAEDALHEAPLPPALEDPDFHFDFDF